MMYLWVKAFHIIFMVTWFAALFYLPRLFVYHAMTEDRVGRERFQLMERKLFGMMTIGMVLTLVFGIWLLTLNPAVLSMGWMHAKLTLVALLIVYHAYSWRLMRDFAAERNLRSHVWYRWFNELPVLVLVPVVILAIVKPF